MISHLQTWIHVIICRLFLVLEFLSAENISVLEFLSFSTWIPICSTWIHICTEYIITLIHTCREYISTWINICSKYISVLESYLQMLFSVLEFLTAESRSELEFISAEYFSTLNPVCRNFWKYVLISTWIHICRDIEISVHLSYWYVDLEL